MNTNAKPTTIETLLAQSRWLDALARRLVADPHEADDIVQETWIAALKHPPHANVPMRSWLARVARNFAIQRGRGESARKKREQSVARDESSEGDVAAIDRAQTHRRLVDAVLALDEPYRSAVVLHYFDHLSVAEIAARQSAPESTVRTRLSRAVSTLRARFRDEGGDAWSAAFAAIAGNGASSTTPVSIAAGSGAGFVSTTAWMVAATIAAVVLVGLGVWVTCATRATPAVATSTPTRSREILTQDSATEEARRVTLGAATEPSSASHLPGSQMRTGLGTLDVRVRWDDDGTAAAGIVVRLEPWNAPDLALDDVWARTDASGDVHFENVSAGNVSIRPDRGGDRFATVVAGKDTKVETRIPNGMDVDGTVVDELDVPVTDASIYFAGFGKASIGAEAARTDARGRFTLRDVRPGQGIAALHDGYGSSPAQSRPSAKLGERVEMSLRLTAPAARIEGTVHDESGHALAGARVEFKIADEHVVNKTGGLETSSFLRIERLTDGDGRFETHDLYKGQLTITVQARGFVPWMSSLRLGSESVASIDVIIGPQAAVHGVVRDADGRPIRGALIDAETKPRGNASVCSRVDGTFDLEHVRPGSVTLHVNADEHGEDQRELQLAAGDDVEWNPVLKSRASVQGHVFDEHGRPLAGWQVGAVATNDPRLPLRQVATDDAGAFTLLNWPADANAVAVVQPKPADEAPVVVQSGITAGDTDVRVRIESVSMHSAFVVGRLFTSDGRPAAHAYCACIPDGMVLGIGSSADAEGKFHIGPIVPGDYVLRLKLEGQAPKWIPGVKLAQQQTLDLGDVHFESPGELAVHLHVPASFDVKKDTLELQLRSFVTGEQRMVPIQENAGALSLLAPGEYVLLLNYGRFHLPYTRVSIAADRTTTIDATIEPGTTRTVQLRMPEAVTWPARARLKIREPGGELIRDEVHEHLYDRPIVLGGVGLGAYQVEVILEDGSAAHATVGVESLEPAKQELQLSLR